MSGTSREMTAEVKLVGEVLKAKGLSIPDYQRPYKWSLKHVNQLVDDLVFHMEKGVSSYRVGTVVLHKEPKEGDPKTLNIVDGQQRLITFSLILHFLKAEDENKGFLAWMEKKEDDNKKSSHLLNHHISCFNLQNNYAAIKQKLFAYDGKEKLSTFILEQCEFVVVTLKDISEAFQFFDSQNARGKGLEPYDLLKAFHLREMSSNTESEQLACVKIWEGAIKEGELKPLFNEYLYRIRQWARNKSAFYFTKDDIDVFKGVSCSELSNYPYLQSYHLVDHYVIHNASKPIIQVDFPFQINQVILNGKRFFEYVEYYRQQLHTVRHYDHKVFKLLESYEGRGRTGDLYTQNLFQAALLSFADKFGMAEKDRAVDVLFRWAYVIRLDNKAVRLATMDNKATGGKSAFKVIRDALHPNDVLSYTYTVVTENKASKVKEIEEYFGIKEAGKSNE